MYLIVTSIIHDSSQYVLRQRNTIAAIASLNTVHVKQRTISVGICTIDTSMINTCLTRYCARSPFTNKHAGVGFTTYICIINQLLEELD